MSQQHVQVGAGPMFLLFLVFLVLKILGKVSWGWLWVTAPLWGSFVLGLGVMFLWLVAVGIVALAAAAKS